MDQMEYCTILLSSLDKVFPEAEPVYRPECAVLTALRGETVSFQIACRASRGVEVRVRLESPLPGVRVREVVNVPSSYPAHPLPMADGGYLRLTPGMYPDLLRDCGGPLHLSGMQWKSFWVDAEVDGSCAPGGYPITLVLETLDGAECARAQGTVTVLNASLPPQTLIRTEWFHGDCIADYYGWPVFSEEHWAAMERFIALGVKRGANMWLTPQFTPPLDTAEGGERTTIQLVGVRREAGEYSFDFSRLDRWVEMCRRAGVEYLEMSHLFTQWGAKAAPKVMATVDGEYRRLFGWDTPAVGGEYTRFLQAYLPQLTERLRNLGMGDRAWFHISDEPTLEQLESYRAAKESVVGLLEGFPIMDALSDYGFYQTGVVERPVCANNHIHTFLEHGVKNLWSYYCTSQCREVSNRFMAMPSARNRIYGAQLFKYDIEGVLHWGYNFYNSQYSYCHLDPYRDTSSGGAFPSGDPFLVYPGPGGVPEESIRMMVQYQAMTDLRAMQRLAELAGKDFVLSLIEGDLASPLTFREYPRSELYLLSLRNRINREIAARS